MVLATEIISLLMFWLVDRDDKMIILQDELSRLSSKYSSSLDEMNSLKQSLITAEIELNHLREITRVTFYILFK